MAEAILAIPGIGSDHAMYDAVAARLATGHDFIGWDLPGYAGRPLIEDYGFSDLANMLRDEIDRRGIERAHLLGHSIGGMVAMEFAVLFPQRVASLMLSGTTPVFGSKDGSFQKQFLADRLKPLDDGMSMQQLAEQFMPDLIAGDIDKGELAKAIEGMGHIPAAAYRAAMRCLVTFNRRTEVEHLTCPVLLLAGAHDRNAPLKTMQRMAEYIPNSRIVVFETAGHMAPIEVPDRFAAAINRFFREIS